MPEGLLGRYLRRARGKAPRFLARRYLRHLNGWLEALTDEAAGEEPFEGPPPRPAESVAFKLIGYFVSEKLRLMPQTERDELDHRYAVGVATPETIEALEWDRLHRKGY